MSGDPILTRVLDLVLRYRHDPHYQFVFVSSPPGGGKTRLVELVATTACHLGLRVGIACPRAEQSLDLARRLLATYPDQALRLWMGRDRDLPHDLLHLAHPASPGCLLFKPTQGATIDIATVSKFAYLPDQRYDLLIVDESFQVTLADIVPLFGLADQVVLAGDPGQLRPLVRIDTESLQATRYRVHEPAPIELLRHVPASPVVRLNVTHRLPPDSAALVSAGFYSDLPFRSAIASGQRSLVLRHPGAIRDGIDQGLNLLVRGASLLALVLPPRTGTRTAVDEEVISVMADVVERMLAQQIAPTAGAPFLPEAIGCIHSRVAAGAALRRELQTRQVSVGRMLIATPEVAQGLERSLSVVGYPVSNTSPSEFELEPGRLCVSLTRHRFACVIVARAGIEQALQESIPDSGARTLGSDDWVWRGSQIHLRFWQDLRRLGRIIPA